MTYSCVSTRCKDLKADATPFSTMMVRARNLWCAILKALHFERLRIARKVVADHLSLQAQTCRGKMVVSLRTIYQVNRPSFVYLNVFLQIDHFALMVSPLRCLIVWTTLMKNHHLCTAYRLTIQGQSGKFNQCKAWWRRLSLVLEGKMLTILANARLVQSKSCIFAVWILSLLFQDLYMLL